MITFFRRIRAALLAEGKTGKYLKYAIGEIVLVVIGILIALSINNWNEARKSRNQEIILLGNIKQDLISDTLDITEMIELLSTFYNEENKLLDFLYISEDTPKIPIEYNMALSTPTVSLIHQSSFNNLQNNDPGLLTSNVLRKTISRHYDFYVKQVLAVNNEMDSYDNYSMKLPYFLKYFRAAPKKNNLINSEQNSEVFFNPDIIRNELQIRDMEGMKNDEEFKIILSESSSFTRSKIQIYDTFIKQTRNLIQAIDLEIEKLSK